MYKYIFFTVYLFFRSAWVVDSEFDGAEWGGWVVEVQGVWLQQRRADRRGEARGGQARGLHGQLRHLRIRDQHQEGAQNAQI